MSNYTKTTNFATKDSLASGNPNKIVKGTEINSEFDNIATAVATKANTASPSLTGTVTAAALNVTGNLDVDGTLEFDSISGTGSVAVTDIADEDNMSSNSATKLATQQSIKAYVDSQVTAQDLDLTDGSTSISIDLDSEALSVLGGTGVTSTASGNGVTLAIDSTVTTLTGSQTLTNKTLTSPDVNTPDIDGGTIDGTVIGGATAAAGSFTTVGATGNITVGGTVDGRDVATDGSKLDGIEASATADQSNAEIRTAVEAASDSNVFTDADHSKLNAIEASATADQTDAEIRTAVEAASDSNVFTDADHTKLNAIEASADVTDTANVTAAGALMDSELTAIASVKALNQGVATGDSPTFVDVTATSLDISGNIDVDGVTNLDVVDIDGAVNMATTALVTGVLTTTAKAVSNGGIGMPDDAKLTFGGTGTGDLQIYHTATGNHSIISESGSGNLVLAADNLEINNAANSENKIVASTNGAVTLFYDNAAKIATASGGITVTGEVAATSLDISGNIDVDGTTNLDVVDIDGAVDMASTLAVAGDANFDSGTLFVDVSVNSVGIGNGTTEPTATLDVRRPDASGKIAEFHQSAGFGLELGSSQAQAYIQAGSSQTLLMTVPSDMTIDAGGDIKLDADSSNIYLADGGTDVGLLSVNSQDLNIRNLISNKDIYFQLNNGGTNFTAFSLDANLAGKATFNAGATFGGGITVTSAAINGQLNVTGTTNSNNIFAQQLATQFDTSSFMRFHPSSVTNSGGFTNIFFGTSTSNNYGVAIGGKRAGTNDEPTFAIRMLNDSTTGTEVLNIANSGAATFSSSVAANSITLADDKELIFGSSSDFKMYHSGNVNSIKTNSDLPLHFLDAGGSQMMSFTPNTGLVINETGENFDFRVKSNGNANALFVDGGTNNVGIGTGSPISLDGNATPGLTISSNGPFLVLQDANNADKANYISNNSGVMQFGLVGDNGATGKTEVMSLSSAGAIFNDSHAAALDFRVESDNDDHALFVDGASGIATLKTGLTVARDTHLGGAVATINSNNAQGLAIGYGTGTNEYRRLYHHSTGLYFESSTNQAYLNAAGVWTDASDITYKKDIEDIDYGIETVKKLKPRKYKMKSDDTEQIGFVAQELVEQVPEIVSEKDGILGVAYGQLTAVLTKAIQEQQTLIESLTDRIAALEE